MSPAAVRQGEPAGELSRSAFALRSGAYRRRVTSVRTDRERGDVSVSFPEDECQAFREERRGSRRLGAATTVSHGVMHMPKSGTGVHYFRSVDDLCYSLHSRSDKEYG